MSEFWKLVNWLAENKYPIEVRDLHGGKQVIVKDEKGETSFDVIFHMYSYGYGLGLLEVMNGSMRMSTFDDDEVEGYLTADEIIERVKHGGV